MSPLLRDRLGSALMLVFIAVLWIQRDYTSPFGGMFPDTIMIIMGLFTVLNLILSFRCKPVRPDATTASEEAEETASPMASRWRVLGVIVLLACWTGLYRPLGFAVTGTLGFAAIAWLLGDRTAGLRGLARALGLGVLVTFVVYLVFDYFLLVPLPAGFLFD